MLVDPQSPEITPTPLSLDPQTPEITPKTSSLDPKKPEIKPQTFFAVDWGNSQIIHELIKAKIIANTVNKYGSPFFRQAISPANIKVLQLLLKLGADETFNQSGIAGASSLHIAAERVNAQMMAVLIDEGANAKALDHNGNTPLHLLVSSFNSNDFEALAPMTKMLIDAGVNVNAVNKQGQTALDLAFLKEPLQIAHELIHHGAKAHNTASNVLAEKRRALQCKHTFLGICK